MLWVLAASGALADEVTVDVPFAPPAEVPLFVKAATVDVRGTVKGPDCAAAVSAALAAAADRGTVVRIVRAADDLTIASQTVCKQRRAGDAVSASVVDLSAIVLEPGSPPSVYPKIASERALQIAAMIGALEGGGIGSVVIDDIDGRAWVRLGVETVEAPLDSSVLDPAARGATVYEDRVPRWIGRWVAVLSAVPEVEGAVLEIVVPHADPASRKSRSTEIFRFAVPTDAASAFLKGRTTDDAFLAASRVDRASDPRKRNFEPIRITVGEGGLPIAVQRPDDRAPIEVPEQDLEGVEDE